MPKLRHVAVATRDVAKTAAFYKQVFDLKEVGNTDSPIAEGVYLSDGVINLAVLRYKDDSWADRGDGQGAVLGLHHVGFWIEDAEATRRRLLEAGATPRAARPEGVEGEQTLYFEEKWKGPDGIQLDISAEGWKGALPVRSEGA